MLIVNWNAIIAICKHEHIYNLVLKLLTLSKAYGSGNCSTFEGLFWE